MTAEMILGLAVVAAALVPGVALLLAAAADVGGPPLLATAEPPAPLAGRRSVALRHAVGRRLWAVPVPRGFALIGEPPSYDDAAIAGALREVQVEARRLTDATGVEFVHLLALPDGWPPPEWATGRICSEESLAALLARMDADMERAPAAALARARATLEATAEPHGGRPLLHPARLARAAAGAGLCAAALLLL